MGGGGESRTRGEAGSCTSYSGRQNWDHDRALHSPLDGEQRLFLACTLQEWPLGFGTWMEARLKLISPVVNVALR